MAIVNSLGAIPTPVSWTELYTSLKTKVAAGQENSIPVINFGKLYEVQDYMILDGHGVQQRLSAGEREVVQGPRRNTRMLSGRAAVQAVVYGRGISRILESEKLAFFENTKQFKEIYFPSTEEKDAFAKIAQPAYLAWFKKEVDPDGVWIGKLNKAVAEAEKAHFQK